MQLFHRTKRRVTITDAGHAFYEEVRVILHRVDRAVELGADDGRGPGREPRHRLHRAGDVECAAAAARRSTTSARPTCASAWRSSRARRSSRACATGARRRLRAAAAARRRGDRARGDPPRAVRRHPAGTAPRRPRRRAVDLAELADEPFIFVPRRVEPGFYDRCIALCQSYGFSPNIVEEGTGPTAICGMVATGLGITLSPASILNAPWPGVVFRELDRPGPRARARPGDAARPAVGCAARVRADGRRARVSRPQSRT